MSVSAQWRGAYHGRHIPFRRLRRWDVSLRKGEMMMGEERRGLLKGGMGPVQICNSRVYESSIIS